MPQTSNQFDPSSPFFAWSSTRDAYLDAWANAMLNFVDSQAFSDATATTMDKYVKSSAPFRAALKKAVTQALADSNLATQIDMAMLAERLTKLESSLAGPDPKPDEQPKATRAKRSPRAKDKQRPAPSSTT